MLKINWDKTLEKFGYTTSKLSPCDLVLCECIRCSCLFEVKYRAAKRRTQSACTSCVSAIRAELSRASQLRLWEKPSYRAKLKAACNTPSNKQCARQNAKKLWKEHRSQLLESLAIANSNPIHRSKIATAARAKWDDPKWRSQQLAALNNPSNIAKLSTAQTTNWMNPEYRAKQLKAFAVRPNPWDDTAYRTNREKAMKTDEYKAALSRRSKSMWRNKEYRDKIVAIIRSRWRDPEYRSQMAKIRATQPRVSSIQTILYSILDDLNVEYSKEHPDRAADPECVIGPYVFDCVIPRTNKPTLLIECQGDYWHNITSVSRRDRGKAAYIAKYFPDKYELKYLWEHEFLNVDKISELIKYWLDVAYHRIAFDFNSVKIKSCPASEYRLLLSKYHYLQNAGRGGIAYGAYFKDTLIAVCVFSPLVRQNISIDGYKPNETRELSRLCIHPSYQQHNFASWFISRCISTLDTKYKAIISYCDTTYNHNGAVYKACNFKLDKEIPPDYWYVATDKWIMHKKTLYEHAKKMKMSEAEFATAYGYTKVYGDKKLRFIYIRK